MTKESSLKFTELNEFLNNLNFEDKFDILKIENVDKLLEPEELNKISTYLNEAGVLEINLENNFGSNEEYLNKFLTNLKFAGFLKVTLSQKENINTITCNKKVWRKVNRNKNTTKDNPWKSLKIEENSNQNLIVEEELIDPFDSYQKFAKADDCITKPKPCKNCSCGRAEKEDSKIQVDPNFKSDCGKCFLGDAFRCAGCPYKGLPAFEPGDKIQFNNTNLNENTLEEEKNVIKITGKKVKLDI